MKKIIIIAGCLLLMTPLLGLAKVTKLDYRIANRFTITGNGGWDYLTVDEPTGRIFVSHSTITQVINSKTGKLLGTIRNTEGVHGIALDHTDSKAFISCGRDATVSVVNLKTLALIAKVHVTGQDPDAILYDSFSGKVFVNNGRSSNVTVIDAHTNKVVATIPLAGKPEFEVSNGKGKVYLNIENKSLISVIDTKTLKVINNWSLKPGEEPSGLAIDNVHHRLFSVCHNQKMVVMNAQNGQIVTSVPIGKYVDGCAFDPQLKRIYSSNGDGTLTVVQQKNPDTYQVITNFPTQRGARTIGIDTQTHHLYLPAAQYGPAPKPTKERPHPWPTILPGTFTVLDIAPVQ